MGKISVNSKEKQRHNPLAKDLSSSGGILRANPRSISRVERRENTEEGFLDAATSKKILHLAKKQQDEIALEERAEYKNSFLPRQILQADPEVDSESETGEYSEFEVEFDGDEEDEEQEQEEEEEGKDDEDYLIDDGDKILLEKFFNPGNTSVTLADKILAKIEEKQLSQNSGEIRSDSHESVMLPPKVIAAYQKIGQILSTYTHGKLPKLFKVLPTLKNWEDVLYVTSPESWSSHATYEATKLFVSNLQANQAQKFIESVLLEKFRTSIEESENHSLDYHLYRAIKKSLYKPGAFFKGFLLPLVDSHCTLREATIVGSVLTKVSVPVLHSSVALSQLVQRNFKPATTVFIRILLEKKYALPYQTLDEVVFYFMRFRESAANSGADTGNLPIVWHKAFLAFAQRYKNDITDDQRDFLLETVRQRFHHAIGPEIRRELISGKPRVESPMAREVIMEEAFQ